MTETQIVEVALRMIQPVPSVQERVGLRTALRLGIKPALESLAQKVGSSPDRNLRNLLRESLGTIAVTTGVASFATLLIGTHPILLDQTAIRTADIRTAAGQKVQMLADRASLHADAPDSFLYGAAEGVTLYTDAPDGDLTVIANYIETDVANLKIQLVPMLLDEMVMPWKAVAA